jgi:hypothetical protein
LQQTTRKNYPKYEHEDACCSPNRRPIVLHTTPAPGERIKTENKQNSPADETGDRND